MTTTHRHGGGRAGQGAGGGAGRNEPITRRPKPIFAGDWVTPLARGRVLLLTPSAVASQLVPRGIWRHLVPVATGGGATVAAGGVATEARLQGVAAAAATPAPLLPRPPPPRHSAQPLTLSHHRFNLHPATPDPHPSAPAPDEFVRTSFFEPLNGKVFQVINKQPEESEEDEEEEQTRDVDSDTPGDDPAEDHSTTTPSASQKGPVHRQEGERSFQEGPTSDVESQ
ncbi:hypothetical protein CRUP_026682, partial [Coryphaenoides rupestris]